MSNVRDKLVDLGFAAGWRLVRALPAGVASYAFRLAADYAVRRRGDGVAQLRLNLSRVVPKAGETELDELVRASMRSYARYWCEAFRLPAMDHETLSTELTPHIAGLDYLKAALAEGNGAIVALSHSGNWDVPGVWLSRNIGRFATVAERLRPESLFQRFVRYRESLGFEILPLTGGAESPLHVLSERLRANTVVCLLADRDLTAGGVPVTLFGHETRMPAGPAYLATTTGASLLPVGSWFTEDGWGFRVHPPIAVNGEAGIVAATQGLADVFAADIAAHPADWHMMQKLWLADLPESRQRALARIARRWEQRENR